MNAEHTISRRNILRLTAAAAALPLVDTAYAAPATLSGVKAMTFDIQGTVFDYYRPFIRIATALGTRKGLRQDWPGFLVDWNAGVGAIIQAVIAAKRSWLPPGRAFREALDDLLTARGLAGQLDEADRLELMSVWGRMVPWHDSVEGIKSLKRTFTVATLSNAGMAGVIALAKQAGLPFDAVLTGELVHSYKPSPDVYRAASGYLGFPPGEIMMVAAHKFDLKAAKAAGFKTAYIPRSLELGPATKLDRSPEPFIDIIANDIVDLSTRLTPRLR